MSGRGDMLTGFLTTDPHDVGCADAMEMLHVYVDLVISGERPELRYPGVAVHLEACGPCAEDFHGLLDAVRRITKASQALGI